MVVYSIKRNVVSRVQFMQEQVGQGPPGRGTMPEVPGKNQQKEIRRLEESPRQQPEETPRAN
jgi:hypothetical protein